MSDTFKWLLWLIGLILLLWVSLGVNSCRKADFGGWEGFRKWLPQYLDSDQHDELKKAMAQDSVKIRFFEYSWKMNRQ